MSTILVFAVAAVASFGLRASMLLVGGRRVGQWSERLPLVAPVMLSTIVANSLTADHGEVAPPSLAALAAVVVAVVAVRRTGSLGGAFVAGFPVFWVMSALGLG